MLSIIWRRDARRQLAEIMSFVSREDPAAARRLKQRLEDARFFPQPSIPISTVLAEWP